MSRIDPEIVITDDGPYELRGDLPVVPKRIVRSELGEPMAWGTSEEIGYRPPARLCRCGASATKPFCDDSHLRVGFDGTETADRDPFFERARVYEGTGIKVYRVGALCAHAGFCGNSVTDWYQLLPDSGDPSVRAQVIAMVEHCPSGALVYELDDEIVEPNYPTAVSPVEDGPLWVTGCVTLASSDGTVLETRNRVALCRCGQSENKPFCDGTHLDIEFRAPSASQSHAPGDSEQSSAAPVFAGIVVGVSPSLPPDAFGAVAEIADTSESDVELVLAGADGRESRDTLESSLRLAIDAGLHRERIGTSVRPGVPWNALADAATAADAGLLVVGRGGDRIARVPRKVVHHAPCDVLVVSRRPRSAGYSRILVATDGSATADRAAKRGFGLARALGAAVDLVFVGHPATGDLIIEDTISLYGDGVDTTNWLEQGRPAQRILGVAAETHTDLMVVGNKGLGRIWALRRSVPGTVLRKATCDVLVSRTVRQLVSELDPGEGGVIEREGEPLAAFVDEDGELRLMSARCPHLGCLVTWNAAEGTFDCPCHGSRFDSRGQVLEGPAFRPLRPMDPG